MGHSRVWSTEEAVPDDNDQISAGAGGIRNHMVDVKERMVLDHIWASSTATDGYHTTIHLQGRGDNPTAVASYALLFAKTGTAGAIELYVTNSGTQNVQLTKVGYVYLSGGRLDNNSYIIATNSAGTANINVWKVDGSNLITAGTALTSTTMVPPLIMSTTAVNTNFNAAYLNYYLAATSATVSTIMVSDTAGRCSPFLKSYNSGWFAVAVNTDYVKTHNLGTDVILVQIQFSSDGSTVLCVQDEGGSSEGVKIQSITTTTLNARTGPSVVARTFNPSAAHTTGYYRVIALALE